MAQVQKKKVVQAISQVLGKPVSCKKQSSKIIMYAGDKEIGTIPNGHKGQGNDALPLHAAYIVLGHVFDKVEQYERAKEILRK